MFKEYYILTLIVASLYRIKFVEKNNYTKINKNVMCLCNTVHENLQWLNI